MRNSSNLQPNNLKHHFSILFCIIFPFTLYCSNEGIVLTKSDEGKTFVVPINSDFSVELKSNPSTGYDWEILTHDSNKIRFKEKKFYSQDSVPGSSGMGQIVFRSVKKGKSFLKLGYLRSWEGRSSMTDSFSVFVKVR